MMALINVLFPLPLDPIIPSISPCFKDNDRLENKGIVFVFNLISMPFNSSIMLL
ncbi:hypothetical protein VFMJ11_0696 [Aliivibrio fischeri MJ11]|uniref:Uncharacterized protein n=1 Tax=Aliivibrio fischeri (strain MJ11) TaxID=388396 RepID=B5FBD2_ALIFM|nr:hypothetical protein VFMJ11_0696 [Aliivibrio fischeri MJ11]